MNLYGRHLHAARASNNCAFSIVHMCILRRCAQCTLHQRKYFIVFHVDYLYHHHFRTEYLEHVRNACGVRCCQYCGKGIKDIRAPSQRGLETHENRCHMNPNKGSKFLYATLGLIWPEPFLAMHAADIGGTVFIQSGLFPLQSLCA